MTVLVDQIQRITLAINETCAIVKERIFIQYEIIIFLMAFLVESLSLFFGKLVVIRTSAICLAFCQIISFIQILQFPG